MRQENLMTEDKEKEEMTPRIQKAKKITSLRDNFLRAANGAKSSYQAAELFFSASFHSKSFN